jgi:hypothetical protein
MKKIIIFILLLVGAAGAAMYFTRSTSPVAGDYYYADYLPQNTLATVSLLDLKGLTDSFPASTLGKFLSKPTVHGILTELGAKSEAITEYDKIYDGLAGVLTNPAFRQIFGDDAVVAILSPDAARLQHEPEQEILKSFVVFGTSSVSGALDSFARLVMSKSVVKESVDGLDITRIQLDENESIYGYTENGVLILAYEPGNIAAAVKRKSVDDSLQKTAFFTAVKKFWDQSAGGREYARTYVNLVAIRTLLTGSDDEDGRQLAGYLQGFKGMGSVIFDRQDELHVTSRMNYDYDDLNDLVKKQYQAVSKENLSLGLLSPETLAYYWVSLVDKDYVKGLLSATDDEQYKKADARVQRELGLSLDEAIDAVGPQTGLVVNEIVNTGLFPLPKVVLFMQIRDHAVALKIVNRLRKDIAGRGFAAEQSEEVNGHTIYYWSILPGEATQPAIVLTDNMIYIANGKSTLAALVGRDSKPGALSTPMAELLGKDQVQNITTSNYTTLVMRPERLATEVKDAADWLAGMLAASNGLSAEMLKQEILKLMHSVDVVTATSNIRKDYAVSSIVLKQVPSKDGK